MSARPFSLLRGTGLRPHAGFWSHAPNCFLNPVCYLQVVSIGFAGVWVRFSAATTAERFLPERLAARAHPFAQRLDAMLASANGNGQAGRMSLIAFSLRIINAVIAFASQVLLARYMGGFEYGIFVLVWVTVIILGNISCLGFHTSVIRFIPEYRAKNMLGELRGMVNASRIFVLLSSTAFMAIGWLGLWLFETQIERYYILPFYLGLICLPMIALGDQLQGIARANAWPLLALAPTYVLRPVLLLLFLFAIHIAGYEPDAENAVLAAILATWLTTIAQAIGMRMQRTEKITAPQKLRLRDWVAVSLPIFLVESIFFLQTNADVLMVGRYMQPTDVAIYYAAVKTLALVHFVYFAVKAGVAQRFATLIHAGDREALSAFVRQSVNWTFWPSLAMGLVVLALGQPILMLFGEEFTQAYPLLLLLVAAVVTRASVGPAESLLTMSGQQNACAAIYAFMLALNVTLNMLLIPHLGLWGAAIATSIAMTCEALLLAYTVHRKLGLVMHVSRARSSTRGMEKW